MHVLVAITSHGFGHAAQVAPVIDALRRRLPALRVTLLTSLPDSFLRERFTGGFERIRQAPDFGLLMKSALDIDLEGSARAYAQLHASWDETIDSAARQLRSLGPDLVLADAPYQTLAAAQRANIPSLALCSLNWADIYRFYFSQRAEASQILADMESAYRAADVFMCPEPSMPMPNLDNTMAIGAIAAKGTCRRAGLREILGLDAGTAVVLVAPGGVQTRFDIEQWPVGQNIHWLVSEAWKVRHPDASPFERLEFSFTDLVASVDGVLGKCGYGTVSECVVNGTPLLYIPRPEWPEEATLLSWLKQHQAAVEVMPERLRSGDFGDIVRSARSLRVTACEPTGVEQAAAVLETYLRSACARQA